MKFLCEHCKAKYQIADDKVAGRTVRMKCRKCGNAIEVRAAVTETSVSRAPPAGRGATVPMGGGIDPAKAYAAAAAGKPGGGLATSLSGARSTATRPLGASVSPQKDGALAGAFQRNVQKEDEASAGLDLHELSAADEGQSAQQREKRQALSRDKPWVKVDRLKRGEKRARFEFDRP